MFALWLMVLALLSVVLLFTGTLRKADNYWHDALTPLLAVRAAPESVTVIDIDERSLQEIGPWPWPRPVLAQLARQLRDKGARLQVWDLFFAQAGPSDAELAYQLQQPDIEVLARQIAVQPAAQLMGQAGAALPSRSPRSS